MIESCVELGYLRKSDYLLDPTYGLGQWWKRWSPDGLEISDLSTGVDFRQLPHADATFDAAVFDPPYVATGSRDKTGIPDFYAAYGLTNCPRTPEELQAMNNAGLKEIMRVVKPKGLILAKCTDYVSSGKLFLGTHHTLTHSLSLGMTLQDRLIYVGRARQQPQRKRKDGQPVRQQHSRQNWSMLFVLKVP